MPVDVDLVRAFSSRRFVARCAGTRAVFQVELAEPPARYWETPLWLRVELGEYDWARHRFPAVAVGPAEACAGETCAAETHAAGT